MTLPLETSQVVDDYARRALERIALQFPIQPEQLAWRTVRGGVTGATGAGAGNGFTSVRNAAGDYTLTFSPAFAQTPVLVAMLGSAGTAVSVKTFGGSAPSTTTWRLATITGVPALVDHDFYFIAIGP